MKSFEKIPRVCEGISESGSLIWEEERLVKR